MRERQEHRQVVVEVSPGIRAVAPVCEVLLDVLAPRAPWACIDAYSDSRDALPTEVERAQTALRGLHRTHDGSDPGMGIDIDRTDAGQETLLRIYAPWSIHVELLAAREEPALAVLHDGASSITAEVGDEEFQELRRRLIDLATVVPLTDRRAAMKEERSRARREGGRGPR